MHAFFRLVSQLEKIDRWSKSNTLQTEYVSSHSLQVGMFAHVLCVIENKLFNGNFNTGNVCVAAMYHDAPEVISEDVNSQFKNLTPTLAKMHKVIEEESIQFLLSTLPKELQVEFDIILNYKDHLDRKEQKLVKAADILSAIAKAKQEIRSGNRDFIEPLDDLTNALNNLKQDLPSVDYFLANLMGAFSKTTDSILKSKDLLNSKPLREVSGYIV